MIRLIFATAATLSIAAPALADIGTENRILVRALVTGYIVGSNCPNAELQTNEYQRFADKIGANYDGIWDAFTEGFKVMTNSPYDRKKLIPEVTKQVSETAKEMSTEILERNRCDLYVETLTKLGLMKKK